MYKGVEEIVPMAEYVGYLQAEIKQYYVDLREGKVDFESANKKKAKSLGKKGGPKGGDGSEEQQ